MAAKGGDTKQGLIITLVLFILLSVILGVTTYLGFDGQTKPKTEAKEALELKNKYSETSDWFRYQAIMERAYIGQPTPDDARDLPVLRDKFNKPTAPANVFDDAKDAHLKFIQDSDKTMAWDETGKKPARTYVDWVKELEEGKDGRKALIAQLGEKASALAQAENANKKLQDDIKKLNLDFNNKIADLEKKFEGNQQTYVAQRIKAQDDYTDLAKGYDKDKGDLVKQIADLKAEKTKLEKGLKIVAQNLKKIESKQPSVVNRLALDKPKGEIIAIDRTGKLPYINLGSADNVKPQLTFRITSVTADGKPGKEKGTLEVVQVLDAHQSQARVTELADSFADPVVKGDLIFNPIWDPSLRKHIAINGVVDLTGAGRDNTEEFILNLKKQGVVVDAYIDIKNGTIKGEITNQTEYLVSGLAPQSLKIRLGDKEKIFGKSMTDMTAAAKENSVTIMPLREFLSVIGYRVPKTILEQNETFNFQSAPPGSKEGTKEKPAKNGTPKEKDEQKED